jgi:hypothetical protein
MISSAGNRLKKDGPTIPHASQKGIWLQSGFSVESVEVSVQVDEMPISLISGRISPCRGG